MGKRERIEGARTPLFRRHSRADVLYDEEMREGRARAWAYDQSVGPYAQGLPLAECKRIEARREIIRELEQV